ncbi:MAG: type IV toxin-antitoxin system AbiEi family antitoxin domain-containing protein [Tissierellales bacterium]|nr:type IV toxin-antitoxin system AbiEi family antitoxin domain-containing protein [Tissierellales bacterium]
MEIMNYAQEMKNRIQGFEYGYVFTTSDFAEISNYENRKKVLMRFANEGLIRRVRRGIYEYPQYSDFLNEYVATSPDKVAKAIARQYGWSIVPYGDTALNMLGLSTQVPAVWCYISDGAYKTYKYEKVNIKFKKTTNKEISKLSYKTALVIQALKALGKNNVDKIVISKIASKLNKEEKEKMYNEAKYATDWIYKTIRSICNEGVNNA